MAQVIGFQIQIDGLGKTVETATELKRAIADVNAELKKTTDVQEIKKLEAKLVDLKAAQMEVNKVVKEQIKSRNEEITATDKANGAYRKLSKELNDQRNRYKDLAAAQMTNTQEAKDLLVSINKLDKELKGIDATVGQFQRNVGGYTEALGQFFPKLGGTLGQVTGAIGGLSMGISDLSKTTGKLNIGLGAVGIALTAFSAIGEIYSSIQDTIEETKNLNILISNFTKASGEQLSDYTSKAQASALTFKKDVNDIAIAANTASKAFGIDFAEAIDFINIGFRQGADAQGEFLDNLREYPVQFAAAGLSLKDYTAIAVNAANQGIYSDQGLNVVKEFGLRITEQTKASKDALTDAFGEEFTTKLLGDLNSRTITTADAFTKVSEKMTDVNVVSSKLQTVVADVFGSAGEDAGTRYITQLGVILKNTDEILKITTPYQQALERQRIENEKLTEAQARFNQSLNSGSTGLKVYVTEAKTAWTNLGATVLGFFDGVGTRFLAYRTAFKEFAKPEGSIITFWKSFTKEVETLNKNGKIINQEETKRLKLLKQQEEQAKKSADAETKRLAEIRTQSRAAKEDVLAAKKKTQSEGVVFGSDEYKKLGKEIAQLEKELEKFNPTESGKKGGEKLAKSFTEGSIAALENQRSELQSAFSNAVVGSDTQKEIAVKLNEVNAQIKTAVDAQNELLGLNAEKKKQDAIEEINQNFKVAQSIVNLARSKQDTTEDEIENINRRRTVLDNDYNREIQRIDALIALEEQGSKQYENLLVERRAAEANYIKGKEGIEKQEKDINDKRVSAEKTFYDKINKLQIESIENEQEREIAAAKQKGQDDLDNLNKELDLIFASETEKARLRKLLTDKTEQEIKDIQDKYKKDKEDKEKEDREKLKDSIANGVNELINFIGTIQSIANQKAVDAINNQIETTENNIEELEAKADKASGIRKKRIERDIASQKELLKQQQAEAEAIRIKAAKEEKRIAIIQAIIQGALAIQRALAQGSFLLAIPTGIAAAAQIATIAAQPLAEGGVVTGQRVNQKQNIPTRSNGDNVLAYVKRGEVVLNQRQQSLLGGSPTFKRLGIKGFAEGGMVPPISPPIQGLGLQGNMNEFLQVMEAKTDAINNRIDRLQAYVVSEDIARDLAEGNKLKINATL